MRRFDTPVAPPGWVGMGAELLRIVDPTGRAIAWLAPGFGANCVGYAVRQDGAAAGGWRHVVRTGGPRELRAHPLDSGCAVLGPESGGEGSAHGATWRFVERDPTAATCAVRIGNIQLALTAWLEDAALHLDLLSTNEGSETVAIAPGLRLCFADEYRDDIFPGLDGQVVTLAGVGRGMGLRVDLEALGHHRLRGLRLPGGRTAIEAREMGAAGVGCEPGGWVRVGVVVAPFWAS
ncbi:MAG: hypothetical protein U0232_00725 [Thermomicrobiales bacterium]